jgi:hypothetical protein
MSSPEVVAMAAMSVTPPANAAEHARLQSHLRAVLRLKAGCDNHNSVTALTVRTYASIVDEVVADVAGELHRAIATGLDTIDSVSQRVPPADDVIADYNAAVAAQEAEAERLRASGIFGESSARDDPSDTRSVETNGRDRTRRQGGRRRRPVRARAGRRQGNRGVPALRAEGRRVQVRAPPRAVSREGEASRAAPRAGAGAAPGGAAEEASFFGTGRSTYFSPDRYPKPGIDCERRTADRGLRRKSARAAARAVRA